MAERGRNQVQPAGNGQATVVRPGHAALFADSGDLTFTPILTDGLWLTRTLPPSLAMEIHLSLADVILGGQSLPTNPIPGQMSVQENRVSVPRGPRVMEEFIARDVGIEQQWLLADQNGWSGDLVVSVAVATDFTVTADADGFLFTALADDGSIIPVAHYGRALAIDAAGQELWAELALAPLSPAPDGRDRYQLSMTFPAAWMDQAQFPLLVDPLLSSLVQLGQSAPDNNQEVPQVAYNPDDDNFLVVWDDYRNGNWDIYGQLLDGDGAPLDENFRVNAASSTLQREARVAYGNGVYLVAWRHDPTASTSYADVYGTIISGTGEIITDFLPIAADNATSVQRERPTDIVYNSDSGQFLVLWRDLRTGWWNVWGRHVAIDGSLGNRIQVTFNSTIHETMGVGAYNPDRDEYLILWEDRSESGGYRDILGRRMSGSGVVSTTETITVATGSSNSNQQTIDLTYLPSPGKYVVAWQDDRNSSWDIYMQRVNADATLDGNNTLVIGSGEDESHPALAHDVTTDGLMLVWRQYTSTTGYDIGGHLLNSSGALVGNSFLVEDAADNQYTPVAAQNSNGDFLVTWFDDRNGDRDIYHRMKMAGGGWGGVSMLHPTAGDGKAGQITYNPDDDQYLVVWQDYRSGTDWDIYGQLVDGDGSLVGENLVITNTKAVQQTQPQVAYGGGVYLVAWQNDESGASTTHDVMGQVISTTGSLEGGTLHIAANANRDEIPTDIVFNSGSDDFLVLYQDEYSAGPSSNTDIDGRHVSTSGTLGNNPQIATEANGVNEFMAVGAYNADSDQYLVVWTRVSNLGNADVIGRRLTGGGTVTTTDYIQLNSSLAANAFADVVYQPASGQYLAVWGQLSDIYGRGVNPDGTLATTNPYTITAETETESNPRLTVDASGVLALWQTDGGSSGDDLWARPLTSTGQPSSPAFSIQAVNEDQQYPALAYGTNNRYQLVWQDGRDGDWNLYTATLDRNVQVTHIQYEYDPLYRLTRADYSGDFNGEYTYAYDAVGNRTVYTTTITSTVVITYQYDAANRLTESVEVGGENTTYQWDNASRLITTTIGLNVSRVYTYSQDGDLTAALVDGLLTTFDYDGDGRRLQMLVAGEVTTYTLDYAAGSRVLLEEGGTFSDTKHYLYGLECIGEQVDADDPETEEWRYYLQDGNHLVRQTANEQAEVTLAWTFSPDGAIVLGEEGPVTHLGCEENAIYDFSTGLIFKNGGYFDPNTGIWITLSGMVIWNNWQTRGGNRRQRRRSKKWLILFLLFLTVLALAGCGTPTPTPIPGATPCPEPQIPGLPTLTPGIPTRDITKCCGSV